MGEQTNWRTKGLGNKLNGEQMNGEQKEGATYLWGNKVMGEIKGGVDS